MMNCPKCGKEQPEEVQICDLCSYTFMNDKNNKKTSGTKTFLHNNLNFFVFFIAILILTSLGTPAMWPAVGLLLIFTWLSVQNIRKSKIRRPIIKALCIIMIVIQNLWLVFTLVWTIDADPITDDYILTDLRSAPREYDVTYELLRSLEQAEKIAWPKAMRYDAMEDSEELSETTKDDIDVMPSEEEKALVDAIYTLMEKTGPDVAGRSELAMVHAENIQRIWKSSESYRAIIHDVNLYEQIADLTEPVLCQDIPFLYPFRELADIHCLYASLACENYDSQTVAVSLIEFDAVIRKLSINVRYIVAKMISNAVLQMNMITANYILNHPATDGNIVALIAEHFQPISSDTTSLQNTCIYDYLVFKEEITKDIVPKIDSSRWKKTLLFFKPNSTIRVYRNYCNHKLGLFQEINASSVSKLELLSAWPNLYPDLGSVMMDSEGRLPWFYEKYNLIGACILRISMLSYDNLYGLRTKVHIKDDLLQIIIAARQEKKMDLSARAYGDHYIIDREKNLIYSPGPDEIAFTEDDISLPFNPIVIDFGEN